MEFQRARKRAGIPGWKEYPRRTLASRYLTINHYIHYIQIRTDPSEGHYVACHDAYTNHQDRRTFETRKRFRPVKALEAIVLSARDQLRCYLEPGLRCPSVLSNNEG